MKWFATLRFAVTLFSASAGFAATNYTVVGWNNLGMHCMDSDYSVFSVLPPYNTINAQLIRGINGTATVFTNDITMTYQAVADAAGSINTTSRGKGNFYEYMGSIFGATLPVDAACLCPIRRASSITCRGRIMCRKP